MNPGRVLNILLVEGSDDRAATMARMLSGEGHAVSRAGTLAEANELCEDGRFDLLITEHDLPDGPACELIAEAGPCGRVPGIVVAPADEPLCRVSEGFRARLNRPVGLAELRRAIRTATAAN